VDELIEAMDRHGVTKSIVMCGGIQVTNDNLAAAVRQYPDRLLGFAGYGHYQPRLGDALMTVKAVDHLTHGIQEFGFRGVGELTLERFIPAPPETLHLELRPIMDVCRRFNVPVYIHTGYDAVTHRLTRDGAEGSSWTYVPAPLKYRDPIHLDEVALEYPDVPIIIAHMGGRFLRHFEAALMLGLRHRNIYYSTANVPPEFITRGAQHVGADRMVWGSDWAWRSVKPPAPATHLGHEANLAVLQQADLTPAQREAILGRTLAELLDIEVP
jgi:predicted TIM-barrel fold metal-dependent hydrolase